jgi:preprotein translocase subunit Sec61beta
MAENKIQMPGMFGGLMRYDSEYKSRFMFNPTVVIAFLVAIIVFILVLKIFWPIDSSLLGSGSGGGIPIGQGGLYLSLM